MSGYTMASAAMKPENMDKPLHLRSRLQSRIFYTVDLPRDPARYVKQEKQKNGYRPRTLHPHEAWYVDSKTLGEMAQDPVLVHFFEPVSRDPDVRRGYFGLFCGAPIITNAGTSERDKSKYPTGLYVVDMRETLDDNKAAV